MQSLGLGMTFPNLQDGQAPFIVTLPLYPELPSAPSDRKTLIVNPRKLEHGFRTITVGISYTLP